MVSHRRGTHLARVDESSRPPYLPFLWLQDFAELVGGAEDLCPGKLVSPEHPLSKVENPLG